MNLELAHQQLEQSCRDLVLGIPITYENVDDFDFSSLPEHLLDGDTNFVRTSAEVLGSRRLEINPNPASEESGVLSFDIFIKSGHGVRSVYKALDILDLNFKHKTINGIHFGDRRKISAFRVGGWAVYSYQYHFVFLK